MARVLTQNWLVDRRHVLRGAGIALALPLLNCMRPLRAADAAKRAKRGVFVYLPNGVNTHAWQMTSDGPDYKLSRPLAALEKHRKLITPVSGMHHPNGLGNHHNCYSIWLTGGKIGQAERNTVSVDQLMAQAAAPQTRFASLELANQGQCLAWTPDGIQLPAQANPAVVFRELFEEPKGGAAAQRRELRRKASILDAVVGEANSLRNNIGVEDRGRLEQYLTSVREVEVRTARADKWLDTPRPKVPADQQARLNRDVSLEQLGEYLRTMYDIIVLAFQTDLTRVATFSTGNEGTGPAVPEIGIKQDRHSLSHHNGNAKLLKDLEDSDAFNLKQFAYFLDRLTEVKDADGPLIETTVALYGSGMAYGHSHGNASLPLVVAGGTALGFKHGRHVDYNRVKQFKGYEEHAGVYHSPVNPKARLSNLLLTIAHKVGVECDKFGDSTGEATELT